mmetsp:Transcript_29138/g.53659  ORF Transcript_29138/g.53659 Transcript_29138/m.53659 type:complete len:335 (+) Transcript_29138:54-1058(+)
MSLGTRQRKRANAKAKAWSHGGSGGEDGTLLTTPLRRIVIPPHRQVLEALPVAGETPAPPAPDQLFNTKSRSEFFSDESEHDSFYDCTDDEMVVEEDVGSTPGIPADLAARFPRRLRITGLSQVELRRAMAAAGATRPCSSSETPSTSASSSTPSPAVSSSKVPLAGLPLDLQGSFFQENPQIARGKVRKKGSESAQREMSHRAQQEVQKRLGVCCGELLEFTGISAKMYWGVPAWVAKYELVAGHFSPARPAIVPDGGAFTLEIVVSRSATAHTAAAAATQSSSSSSSSRCSFWSSRFCRRSSRIERSSRDSWSSRSSWSNRSSRSSRSSGSS